MSRSPGAEQVLRDCVFEILMLTFAEVHGIPQTGDWAVDLERIRSRTNALGTLRLARTELESTVTEEVRNRAAAAAIEAFHIWIKKTREQQARRR